MASCWRGPALTARCWLWLAWLHLVAAQLAGGGGPPQGDQQAFGAAMSAGAAATAAGDLEAAARGYDDAIAAMPSHPTGCRSNARAPARAPARPPSV